MSDQATTHPLRVAFYARVAHDTDGAHARIAHQAARARAKIEHAPDWALIESITDTGSGLRLQPGLRRLLNQARNGQFDLLLVERPRSLGRSTRLLATIFAELDRCAVILRT